MAKPSKPKPAPAPVEQETPTGRIIARVMPARGQDAQGRWYWRARKSLGGVQFDEWTGRAHRPEVVEQLAAIAAGLAPAVSDRRRGEPEAPRTVGDLLDRWLSERVEDARDLATGTRRLYRIRVANVRAALGHVALEAFAARHLATYKAGREREGIKAGTIKGEVTSLRAGWQWGRDCGFVVADFPAFEVRVSQAHRRTPTIAELARVVALAPAPVALALKVQAATGARVGEVAALLHADIDLDPETRNGWLRLGRHEGARKTGERRVPIHGEVVEALRAVHRPGEPGRVWGRGADSRIRSFLRLLDWNKAKCEPFTSHGIRRLAADTMARQGVEVATAANILGHSVAMMLNVYRQVTDDDRTLAVRRAGLGDLAVPAVVSLDAARKSRDGGGEP